MNIWRNINTNEEMPDRPRRIRLPDGMTRTNEDITDQQLAQAGWVIEARPDPAGDPLPEYNPGPGTVL